MRFRLVEDLLLEDIASVKAMYPNISDSDFNDILEVDPTYKSGSNKTGKYTKWICNLLRHGAQWAGVGVIENGTLYPLEDVLRKFTSLASSLPNRDINQFKTAKALTDAMSQLSEDDLLTDRQKERRIRKAYHEANLLFSDSEWELWTPQSYAASCTLGKGTSWCTAYSGSDSDYNRYVAQGPLYILISKVNPSEKYQFHFETSSFMDATDTVMTMKQIYKVLSDSKLATAIFNLKDARELVDNSKSADEIVNGYMTVTDEEYIEVLDGYRRTKPWEYIKDYESFFEDIQGNSDDGLFDTIWNSVDYYPDEDEIVDALSHCSSEVINHIRDFLQLDDTVSARDLARSFVSDDGILANVKNIYEQAIVEGTYSKMSNFMSSAVRKAWLPYQCDEALTTISINVDNDSLSPEAIVLSFIFAGGTDSEDVYDFTGDTIKDNLFAHWFTNLKEVGEPPYQNFTEFSWEFFETDLLDEMDSWK